MPSVEIKNLTAADFEAHRIALIEAAIRGAIYGIPELNLGENDDDTVFSFPWNPATRFKTNIPVLIQIEILFDKPERTLDVRRCLAKSVGQSFGATVRAWRFLEELKVSVHRFNPQAEAFWDMKSSSYTL